MRVTVPAAWVLTATPREDATLPTASKVDSQVSTLDLASATASGGGPAALAFSPKEISDAIWAPLMAPKPPKTIRTAMTATK